ncbi:hypothetical protein M5689_018920 [Euphorbia peplus]|nr:hypothetical protein M5689_018920 [Euphorbia peplus]
MHSQNKEQEKTLRHCYRFVRGQTYLQNEYLTTAVYMNNKGIKILLEDAQQQRPQTGLSLPEMRKNEADFKIQMEKLNSLRTNKFQLNAAIKDQQKLMAQGALGEDVVYGQTGEKPEMQGGPSSDMAGSTGVKRSSENISSGSFHPLQKKPRKPPSNP